MIKRDLYYERIPTKSLREDVRYLGDILGRVIKKQEGQSFFKLVEDTRLLSKANLANKHVKDPFKNILNKINNLNPKNTFK
ncbi:phosphoenolpyruvate carboxylase, partial [Candidatus Pelagibacter ubique]|nr:phosphoenolpyruvate carboxylase [Candidatus Pelagibacter ubique]